MLAIECRHYRQRLPSADLIQCGQAL